MNELSLVDAIQGRTARIAVGASTVRGLRVKGVVAAARAFLRKIELKQFGVRDAKAFASRLDITTEQLRKALPRGAQHWGIARKVLNIFVRDALYNVYLRDAYHLDRVEAFLEVPLDSITAKQLKKAAGRRGLPKWVGVKYVTPAFNSLFQANAAQLAAERSVARVHLDAYWWSASRDAVAP